MALSDTIHDNLKLDDFKSDILNYRENSTIYDYPDSLLDEVDQLINRLNEIRIKLDVGIY